MRILVINPNASRAMANVKLAETLVDLGLSHSKARLYAAPRRGSRSNGLVEGRP